MSIGAVYMHEAENMQRRIKTLEAEVERLKAAWTTLFPLLDPMDMDEHQHGAYEFLRAALRGGE